MSTSFNFFSSNPYLISPDKSSHIQDPVWDSASVKYASVPSESVWNVAYLSPVITMCFPWEGGVSKRMTFQKVLNSPCLICFQSDFQSAQRANGKHCEWKRRPVPGVDFPTTHIEIIPHSIISPDSNPRCLKEFPSLLFHGLPYFFWVKLSKFQPGYCQVFFERFPFAFSSSFAITSGKLTHVNNKYVLKFTWPALRGINHIHIKI